MGAAIVAGRPALADAPESVLARVKRTGLMRYGVVNGQPPYCDRDVASGAWRGFIVDMAHDLAATLGVTAQPVESNWGNAVLDIQAGKVDVFFGLAPSPERARVVDFTHPLYQNAFALIARRGFAPASWADLDRPEVRIALEIGTVYDLNIAKLAPHATVTRLRTNRDATLSIVAGRAECQIVVVIFALTTLTRNPELGHLVVPQPVFGATTNGMVAREADPAWRAYVDAWIDQRRGAGVLRRMLVANLELVGVKASDVPNELLF
jgi:polar amino acid transport system substrate-binding protein